MTAHATEQARETADTVYRSESRRIMATLIRLLGDFNLAEDALQDAFAAAVEQWPRDGVPAHPRAWLVSAGRFKTIDTLRRRARFNASLAEIAEQLNAATADAASWEEGIEDDRLRLIFTCCHPALSPDAQIALTLRTVCSLTTEEIAHAFLTRPETLAQGIVRAKARIRDARIPYEVPARADLPARLGAVLHVIYLVFHEGYSASSGVSLTRADLSAEAIRLDRLLVELLPDTEAIGLLALMLLHNSRRAARTSPAGDRVLLGDQDRSLWKREQIAEGCALVERFMVIVKANQDREAGVMPSEQILAEMTKYNEERAKAGVMLAGEGLHPSSRGARVRFAGAQRTVTERPFPETKELIAGFWLWKVNSKEEAIEWLKRVPFQEGEVEIRQVFEAEDFGAEFTPELRAREERIRAQVSGRQW